ncbi:hypothetical protein M406DRAFT_66274 [Cryphonectria parasitica EP155]|uniref:Uncharacterized protein n=1 Tax=Cryphonectria parasitica (strain ATCC 38755 / EP155) TaxID=660469 RepID=A0A9P4YBF3_CRYP1|nr:uncharacterized protein M406DRAFT_66274 [Cryphonectria parasitica EP155]KAF3769812.1 hypothetical protein M406DRAFT_66274 [Cryphonectria parasitica EP155]
MVYHHRRLSSLSSKEVTALASLLSLPVRLLDPTTGVPSDLWLASQARNITTNLPKPLLRPHNLLSRLYMSANRHLHLTLEDVIPECAVLCPAHHDLNPWVVRQVFLLVTEEVTSGLVSLEKYLVRPGRYNNDKDHSNSNSSKKRLDSDTVAEIRDFVDRMHALLNLSTGSEVLDRVGCPDGARVLPRIQGGCEACVVAVIGASAGALCDLQAGLCGRSHRKGEPALLRLVQAWISNLPRENDEVGREEEMTKEKVMRQSERLARTIKRVRRLVCKKKHRRAVEGWTRGGHRSGSRHGGMISGEHGSGASRGELSLDVQRSRDRVHEGAFSEAAWPSEPKGSGALSTGKQKQLSSPSKTLSASTTTIAPSGPRGRHRSHSHNSGKDTTSHPHRTGRHIQQHHPSTAPSSHHRSAARAHTALSYADTIEQLIDCYHIEEESDDNDHDQNDDDCLERSEVAGLEAARASQRWWEAFSDVGEQQHPAFRSQVAASAVPSPLDVNREGDGGEEVFDPTQWTDISVHTTATPPLATTTKTRRTEKPPPHVPTIPPQHRFPLLGGDDDDDDDDDDEDDDVDDQRQSAAWYPRAVMASSVYSNDWTVRPHPTPARAVVQSNVRAAMPSRADNSSNFMSPGVAPCAPRLASQVVAEHSSESKSSRITAWPAYPRAEQITTDRPKRRRGNSRHHHQHQHRQVSTTKTVDKSSSKQNNKSTATIDGPQPLTPQEFRTALTSINRFSSSSSDNNRSYSHAGFFVFEGDIPEGTVLPGESASNIGNREYVWALQNGELERARAMFGGEE